MPDDKPILIRTNTNVDVAQLAALFEAVGFSRPKDAVLLTSMVRGAHRTVSAWDPNDRLVGFAREVGDGVSNGYISTVAVLPSYQRRGIGRRLIEALLEGQDQVKFVLHTSDAGEALYRSLGFVDAHRMLVRDRR